MTYPASHQPQGGQAGSQPSHSGQAISILKVAPRRDEGIVVTSPSVGVDGRIDPAHSAAEDGGSPELAWDTVADAGSFALIVEDPDAPREAPFVHWMIWNLPPDATGLAAGIGAGAHPAEPAGAEQARNHAGTVGWYGPKPPPGHGPHHYHFQLFVLDGMLELDPHATDVSTLVNAIKGRTLVSGELVGTFETPAA